MSNYFQGMWMILLRRWRVIQMSCCTCSFVYWILLYEKVKYSLLKSIQYDYYELVSLKWMLNYKTSLYIFDFGTKMLSFRQLSSEWFLKIWCSPYRWKPVIKVIDLSSKRNRTLSFSSTLNEIVSSAVNGLYRIKIGNNLITFPK